MTQEDNTGFETLSPATCSDEQQHPTVPEGAAASIQEADVLLGRGRGCTGHDGNQRYLNIVEQYAPIYCKANSRNKQNAVKQKVIEAVRPGRFLQPRGGKKDTTWVEAPQKVILDKIGQVSVVMNTLQMRLSMT